MGLTLHPTDALVFLVAALLLVTVAASWPGFVVQAVDRQIRVPWTRDRLAALSREAALRALFVALRPFGRWWPLPPPALARRAVGCLPRDAIGTAPARRAPRGFRIVAHHRLGGATGRRHANIARTIGQSNTDHGTWLE